MDLEDDPTSTDRRDTMAHRSLAAALTFALPVLKAMNAGAADVLPFPATERTLPNGLKVIVVPTGFPNLVSIQIPVQTGSRNEIEPGKSGFAHFFEHMMFRGTRQYPPEKYQEILTRAGARQNAYTTDDYTNYHVTFAKEDLETLLKIEADRFQNLEYSEEAFKTEARAVLGEYNKNSAQPAQKLFEVQREHAFKAHPYRHTTMGFLKDIENMPNEFAYSRTFFDRWYRPEYTTILVAGDVTPEPVFALVEKYWGAWKRGSYKVDIPAEPAPTAPVRAHVDWPTDTLPWVSVGFHGPAFSETAKDMAAMDMLSTLYFGPTSELYRKLVEQEQKLDTLSGGAPDRADAYLVTAMARLKKAEDAPYVRDEILKTFARAGRELVSARDLDEAKSNARYSLIGGLDDTESIAAIAAGYVRHRRSWDTLNNVYRVYDTLTPEDLRATAKKYFVDAGLVQATLSHGPLPAAIEKMATLDSVSPKPAPADLAAVVQKSLLPQLAVKLSFAVGSAHDPEGKEGLAALTATMVTEGGSKALRIDEIKKALFPIAGGVYESVDKEMTTFTFSVHRDNWTRFGEIALPMLLDPAFREDDFKRIKDQQRNGLVQDLRTNNEEELGKEELQASLFAGTPYGHPTLGTVAGLDAITLDDVRGFWKSAYTRAALTLGVGGDVPDAVVTQLREALAALPAGPALKYAREPKARRPVGLEVEIIQKKSRAVALSLGHPIDVTRAHPDFAALSVARAWLGEHRSSMSRLFQRIREVRGMNYGDYAYIEAFPGGMYRFFPAPNNVRRAQLFEIWIRPVVPANAHMALRIALHELRTMIDAGLNAADFESTRNYLMKNVYLLTSTQEQQLGYALDSKWYGTGEYTAAMRERLQKLTVADVNAAIKKHLSGTNLRVVIIADDAEGLRQRLVSDEPSSVAYDAPKPELAAEDKAIGSLKLGIKPEAVKIVPVEDVFAR
jgi:zinc protease